MLPGTRTIPEQIVSERKSYFEALEEADAAWRKGNIDVSKMETLLTQLLAKQLTSFVSSQQNNSSSLRKTD